MFCERQNPPKSNNVDYVQVSTMERALQIERLVSVGWFYPRLPLGEIEKLQVGCFTLGIVS